jgi:pSer/pThr/pTyr-binding forkhead associated (FHA) protein
MAKLIFIDKNFAGQVYELVLERTTVGRGEQNTLVIPDNSLSATHCEILVNASEVIVRDLNSSNGTFVNGVRLKNQQSEVRQGQTVRFGSVEARLDLELVYDNGPASEPSAIYAHDRFTREQERRTQEHPKPTNASKHLLSAAKPVVEEHTVLLPAEVLTAPAPTPSALPKVEPRTPSRSPSVMRALLERLFGKKAGVADAEGQTPAVESATHAPCPLANRGSASRKQIEDT